MKFGGVSLESTMMNAEDMKEFTQQSIIKNVFDSVKEEASRGKYFVELSYPKKQFHLYRNAGIKLEDLGYKVYIESESIHISWKDGISPYAKQPFRITII